jgi:DNA-binding transcriptional MerR regulator
MITTRGVRQRQERQMLTVGQVAREFGVTVRTLHHYDEVGLLSPSQRSPSGYRLYTESDVLRLRHVVAYRRLGFSLDDVSAVLEADADPVSHLRRQREAVSQRIGELSSLAEALDRAMEAEMNGYQITKEEQREIFGEAFSDEYAAEAQERWGDTDAWAQSAQRTKHYSKEQWQQVKVEMDEINDAFAALLRSGEPATGAAAMDVAEQARQHITTRFYDCPPKMHADIAQMYVDDPRFRANYESHTTGLARFVRDAVQANSERQGGGQH